MRWRDLQLRWRSKLSFSASVQNIMGDWKLTLNISLSTLSPSLNRKPLETEGRFPFQYTIDPNNTAWIIMDWLSSKYIYVWMVYSKSRPKPNYTLSSKSDRIIANLQKQKLHITSKTCCCHKTSYYQVLILNELFWRNYYLETHATHFDFFIFLIKIQKHAYWSSTSPIIRFFLKVYHMKISMK